MPEPLPDEDLRPTHTPFGVDPESQATSLRELRTLTNAARATTWWRDDRMVALALSNSVSRPDMARAIGLSLSRVDQIIANHYKMLQDQKNAAARDRVLHHLPPHLHHLAPPATS